MDELEPLNWNILDLVSRMKISSWLSEDRAKATCHQNEQLSKWNKVKKKKKSMKLIPYHLRLNLPL